MELRTPNILVYELIMEYVHSYYIGVCARTKKKYILTFFSFC